MSCCDTEDKKQDEHGHCHDKSRVDYLLYSTLSVIVVATAFHLSPFTLPYFSDFSDAAVDILKTVWWGLLFGLVAVGFMNKIPRSYFNAMLGRGDTFGGLIRAAIAGLVLDLCSHGILMVGAKLYERGASLGQVMTFLIASPWNSLSLTLILIALIGLKWTLVFIAGSVVIAILTGYIFMRLVKHGVFPESPYKDEEHDANFSIREDIKEKIKGFKPNASFFKDIFISGWTEGRMVMRWLFLGIIIAALIRAFVSTDLMVDYFGPTFIGLVLTLIATTIIEVCSEGSAPIGAELVTRAGAPGNGFAFLMAGVATDYTEIMVIREFTKRWMIALALPLITVPQVLLIGWILNNI